MPAYSNDLKLVVRHWHRYWIHWIGLVGLIFLLWGWFGSLRYSPTLSYGTCKAEYYLGVGDGSVAIGANWHKFYTGLEGSPELGFQLLDESPHPDDEITIFAPAFHAFHKDEFNSSGLFVGQWLIVLLYSAVWVGLIGLWRRRLNRRIVTL